MFAALYIPDFLADAIVRLRPELRQQAVAVVEGTPPLAYVVAVNDHARQLGIHQGMTRLQAEAVQAIQARNTREKSAPKSTLDVNATSGDPRFHLVRDAAHMNNAQENGWLMSPTPGEASEHPRTTSSFGRSSSARPRSSRAPRTPAPGNITVALCQRSPRQETAAHAALLDAAHALSPQVEDTAHDLVVLDLAGLERLFGTTAAIARELSRRIAAVGLEANIAVASNPNAAMHAARGFPGTTIIPDGTEADRLGSLPIEILCANYVPVTEDGPRGRSRKSNPTRNATARKNEDTRKRIERIIETLDRWGIRNFRALAALPPVSLSERLGADGVRLQQLAAGRVTRDLVLHDSPLVFEEALELDYPVELIEPLAFLLSRMLEQLCARLAARALSTNELRLRMELEHRTSDEATTSSDELALAAHMAERKLTLPVPMNDARLFLKLLQLELQSNPPGAPVTRIWLTAEPSRPRVAQAGLFVPLAPEPEKLELTLARIHRVLRGVRPDDASADANTTSELRAGSAELLDTHQPDAFRMVRFHPPAATDTPQNEEAVRRNDRDPASSEKSTLLPVRVFRPPLPAEVEMREGRPVRVICAELGVKSASVDNLVWVAGPWRTSGNWWMEGEEEGEAVPGSQFLVPGEKHSNKPPQSGSSRKTTQELRTRNQELGSPRRTANGERGTCFSRDEWDVALAITTITPGERRSRQTNIALYRLYRDTVTDTWRVAGSYD